MDSVRSLDRQLERWAWQLAAPDAVKPDVADLETARDRLRRLAAGEDESARKAHVLLRRAEELHRSATSRRALAKHALEPASAPRSLVPAHKAAGCSGAVKLPVGEWIVDPSSTAEGLWLAFTAPEAGTWVVHTAGSRADTKLERWSDCASSAPTEVNDDGIGLRSRLVIEAEAGETVRLRLESTADDRVLVAATRGATGSLSGRVTAAVTGEPISDVRLEIYRLGGFGSADYIGSTYPDAQGFWQSWSLESGTYLVRTDVFFDSNYFDQIYDGVDCPTVSPCALGDGTPIELEGPVSGIDFALHEGATVSGRVLEETTGLAIEGAWVEARSLVDSRSDTTDGAGRYRIRGLRGNEVRVFASSPLHRDELWLDADCEGGFCDSTLGVPIPIVPDSAVSGIDFELARLGSLSGRVTSAATGLPRSSVSIEVFDAATGEPRGSATTNAAGAYVVGGLEAGEYRVRASEYGILPTFWPGETCFSDCVSAGDPVSVTAAERVEDIDFVVSTFGSIEGEVVDEETAEKVESGEVVIYDALGNLLGGDYLYQGTYRVDRLHPGSLRAVFRSTLYQDEVWSDVACSLDQVCDPMMGDPIVVATDDAVEDIDFVASPYQELAGRVTWEETGEPAVGVEVEILVADSPARNHVRWTVTDSDGRYAFDNTPPGTYFVHTTSDEGLDEVYDDIPCEGFSTCEPSTGTGVVVGLGSPTTGIDFALSRLASFRGTVLDSVSGEPVSARGTIYLFHSDGGVLRSTFPRQDGSFEIVGVPAGTYFLAARHFDDHLDRDVGAGNCSSFAGDCDPLAGTPFVVELATEIVQDIDLDLGATLEGGVFDSTGGRIEFGWVYLYDASGQERASTSVSFGGIWRFSKLEAGEYRMLYDSNSTVTTWWPDQPVVGPCPFELCDPSGAPSVTVALGETRSSLDFTTERFGSLRGELIDSETGEPLTGPRIALYAANGSWRGAVTVNQGVFQFPAVAPESHFLVVEAASRHLEQVYGGEFCDPHCSPTSGTPITVPLGTTTMVTVPVDAGPGVSGRVLDAATGTPIPGVGLDLWNDSGQVLESTASGLDGSFRLFANGGGTHYVSTDTGSAYGDIVWEGVVCPDGPAFDGSCDPTSGTPIVLGHHQALVPIEIRLGGGTPPMIFRDGFESGTMGAWSPSP